MWGEKAAADLGLTLDRWWVIVEKCRWFTFDEPGPSGWVLTEEGRHDLAVRDAA